MITKQTIQKHIETYCNQGRHQSTKYKYDYSTLRIIYDNGEDLFIQIKRRYIPERVGFSYIAISDFEECEIEIPYLQYTKQRENQLI